MGNNVSNNELCLLQDQKGTLDLSLHVNYEQYCQHALGVAPQGSLTNLTPKLPTSPTLYSGLIASFNWLSEIPPCIPHRLPHIVILDLSHNRLPNIPDVVLLGLPHLRDLSLSHNLMSSLPDILPLIPKLNRLNCSHNAIETLPTNLGACTYLRSLDCSKNRIKHLPTSLGSSHNLCLLLAAGNPCVSPPKDICEKGSEETLKYLRAVAHGMDPTSLTAVPNIKESQRQQKLVFPRTLGGTTGALGGINAVGGVSGGSREKYLEMHGHVGLQTARGLRTPLFPPPGSTNLDALELRDRIAGLLFGAAIGDSIGLATEFLSPDECMFHYTALSYNGSQDMKGLPDLNHDCIIRDGHRVRWHKGDWTSHCEIMFLVLDSILQWGGVVDELDFAQRLKSWADQGNATSEGEEISAQMKETEAKNHYSHISSQVIRKVISKPNFCSCPHDAAHSVWKEGRQGEESQCLDNGSLPQSVVLGIPHFHNLTEVSSNSSRICQTLHQDPTCLASSVAVSAIVAQLLQGKLLEVDNEHKTLDNCLDAIFMVAKDLAGPYLKDMVPKVQAAFEACFWTRTENELQTLVCEEMQHSFTTLSVATHVLQEDRDSVRSAEAGKGQWKRMAQGERFRYGVSKAAILCGHASANCCLSGALLGAVVGYSDLPAQWVLGLNASKRSNLTSRINSLLNIMALP
ncbi:hypothetical protein J437_LFUL013116 [Ladona fulva]|uniref:Uncharacterized protein n=1 Tax=Ladona fulva TaxID=123851 RepID=A0A8K0P6F7_LADFU|nr:hypothetical protein J437_LFUL013116 [Ladona fulva]